MIRQNPELIGFNVTIPYKQSVLAYCTHVSPEVVAIGASNCISIKRLHGEKHELTAYNTDYFGWMESLKTWYFPSKNKALVLGSGGSSKAIQYALNTLHIPFEVAGRTLPLNYTNINLQTFDLIINCTPAGMLNQTLKELHLPYQQIDTSMHFYDLVYNPSETAMMAHFKAAGAQVKNGLEMLHLQADKSWEIFQSI